MVVLFYPFNERIMIYLVRTIDGVLAGKQQAQEEIQAKDGGDQYYYEY